MVLDVCLYTYFGAKIQKKEEKVMKLKGEKVKE